MKRLYIDISYKQNKNSNLPKLMRAICSCIGVEISSKSSLMLSLYIQRKENAD